MAEIEKIVLHYKGGKTKVVKKGMVAYEEIYDNLYAEFLNVDEKDIPMMLRALTFALQEAQKMVPKKG